MVPGYTSGHMIAEADGQRKWEERARKAFFIALMAVAVLTLSMHMTFAAGEADTMRTILESVIENIIYPIFTAIGVIFTAYGIGAMALAFKNDDPDSKSRASQTLVVGVALIAIRALIGALKLTQYL